MKTLNDKELKIVDKFEQDFNNQTLTLSQLEEIKNKQILNELCLRVCGAKLNSTMVQIRVTILIEQGKQYD